VFHFMEIIRQCGFQCRLLEMDLALDPVHGELPNWPEYGVWQVTMDTFSDL
jgi:hypothetical protein